MPEQSMSLVFLIISLIIYIFGIVLNLSLMWAVLNVKRTRTKKLGVILWSAFNQSFLLVVQNSTCVITITILLSQNESIYFDFPNATPIISPESLFSVLMNLAIIFLPTLYMSALLQVVAINAILRFDDLWIQRFILKNPLAYVCLCYVPGIFWLCAFHIEKSVIPFPDPFSLCGFYVLPNVSAVSTKLLYLTDFLICKIKISSYCS